MIFSVREEVQDTIVNLLREAFRVDSDFPYTDDPETTEIDIYLNFPKVATRYPIVVVSNLSGPSYPRTFGNDLVSEGFGDVDIDGLTVNGLCYQIFGGAFDLSTEIFVGAQQGATRTKLLDRVVMYLRYVFRDYLESRGIDVTRVDVGGQRTEAYGATLLHFNGVKLEVFVQWKETIWNVELLKDVQVRLSTISIDGTTSL